ncbi:MULTISPECIES: type 1 glutamine amidotransferase domain-containing protein [unclassified Agromyces]|uniref:type 1 glutamine amidotransferase domain-containing protein n=1 Tax=unclassified Agromyces TaxID=2639701 RepID=UPI0007B2F4A8|nr:MULTISPECIES: type 1 glutamine amidotransferase domain-containing protein [unclassified Agromyces]KZE94484.1 putative cysteine protease YraA [Agromyces sp. NDB4Y10]MCK8610436.1 type 1 glutamine amidotransferase [Agromyces sp. C10]
MAERLDGKKVAFLVTDGFEQVELTEPWNAIKGAGAEVDLVSPTEGTVLGMNHIDKGDTFDVDRLVTEASADGYDALVLPGGVVNADHLRMDDASVAFARAFFEQHKPVAVICHGAWTLVEADVVRGRTLTSYPSLQTDLRNAGADWVDEEVVVDQGLVSSRNPDDLPAFIDKAIEEIAEGEHAGQTA